MSDFGDKSGAYSSKGYDYQRLIATYYLIVKEAREIEYEVDGEDVLIINEDPNRDSLEYIQAKCKSTGSFSLSGFSTQVFPQFWDAYSKALINYADKAIYCTLITSVAWDLKLKMLMNACINLRERGLTLSQIEPTALKRQFDSMKRGKDIEQFGRFLWGLGMIHTFPPDHVKGKIIDYMTSCGVSEPRSKLEQVISHISEIGQGRITRRQIEGIVGNNLIKIEESSDNHSYSQIQIGEILTNLEAAKSKYGTKEEVPDEGGLCRNMAYPVDQASKVIQYQLEEKGRTSDFPSEEIQEAYEITLSDAEKAREEAHTIASIRWELWSHETRYTQRISSMQKTANAFGINI